MTLTVIQFIVLLDKSQFDHCSSRIIEEEEEEKKVVLGSHLCYSTRRRIILRQGLLDEASRGYNLILLLFLPDSQCVETIPWILLIDSKTDPLGHNLLFARVHGTARVFGEACRSGGARSGNIET